MKKSTICFLFILLAFTGLSQNVVITGKAANQANKLVRIIVYSDQFSMLEKTIAQTRTNNLGEFTMEFDVDETQFAFLALGLDKGEFYLSPNSNYNFIINIDTTTSNKSIFDRLPLRFTLQADDEGITEAIGNFNTIYNNFIYNNINSIYKSRDKSVVTNFITDTKKNYSKTNLKYVNNYIDYSLASLLWLSRKEKNNQIIENYFINKPVLYNNIQYTAFFKDFFKSYFTSEKLYTYNELVFAINNSNIDALQSLILRNEQFKVDTRLCEIIEMLLLSRNYYNRDIIKENVITKLNKISKKSRYTENRLIATNYIKVLMAMQNGSTAPHFALVNNDLDTISLNNFKGQFIVLNFIKDNCSICNHHMQLLNDIKNNNQDKFEIVTIVAGNNIDNVVSHANEKGFNWPILQIDTNILLLEDYNIATYPSYVFINPDGTIAYAHLPMPDENMELYLQRFMESYNNK